MVEVFPPIARKINHLLLRGAIANRTYGTHENLYSKHIFTYFYEQYLVLFTMAPRDRLIHNPKFFSEKGTTVVQLHNWLAATGCSGRGAGFRARF